MALIPLLRTLYRSEELLLILKALEKFPHKPPMEGSVATALGYNIRRLLNLTPDEIQELEEYIKLSPAEKKHRVSQENRAQKGPNYQDIREITLFGGAAFPLIARPKAFRDVDDVTWRAIREQVEFSEISERIEAWTPPHVNQLLIAYACHSSINNSQHCILFTGLATVFSWDIFYLRERIRTIPNYEELIREFGGPQAEELTNLIQGKYIREYEQSLGVKTGASQFSIALRENTPNLDTRKPIDSRRFSAIFEEARSKHALAIIVKKTALRDSKFCIWLLNHFHQCVKSEQENLSSILAHPLFSVDSLQSAAVAIQPGFNLSLEEQALFWMFNDKAINALFYSLAHKETELLIKTHRLLMSWRDLFQMQDKFRALIDKALSQTICCWVEVKVQAQQYIDIFAKVSDTDFEVNLLQTEVLRQPQFCSWLLSHLYTCIMNVGVDLREILKHPLFSMDSLKTVATVLISARLSLQQQIVLLVFNGRALNTFAVESLEVIRNSLTSWRTRFQFNAEYFQLIDKILLAVMARQIAEKYKTSFNVHRTSKEMPSLQFFAIQAVKKALESQNNSEEWINAADDVLGGIYH